MHKESIFKGQTFVLVGTVPKMGKKKLSQADFKSMVKDHGGRVKYKVPPASGKGASTKKYIVLIERVGALLRTKPQLALPGHNSVRNMGKMFTGPQT